MVGPFGLEPKWCRGASLLLCHLSYGTVEALPAFQPEHSTGWSEPLLTGCGLLNKERDAMKKHCVEGGAGFEPTASHCAVGVLPEAPSAHVAGLSRLSTVLLRLHHVSQLFI